MPKSSAGKALREGANVSLKGGEGALQRRLVRVSAFPFRKEEVLVVDGAFGFLPRPRFFVVVFLSGSFETLCCPWPLFAAPQQRRARPQLRYDARPIGVNTQLGRCTVERLQGNANTLKRIGFGERTRQCVKHLSWHRRRRVR